MTHTHTRIQDFELCYGTTSPAQSYHGLISSVSSVPSTPHASINGNHNHNNNILRQRLSEDLEDEAEGEGDSSPARCVGLAVCVIMLLVASCYVNVL